MPTLHPFDPKTVFLAKHAQHVVLIHFPIALLVAAVAFDLIARRTKRSGMAETAYYNLLLGIRVDGADVKIDNSSFGPQTLTVTVGTTVTWTNRDDIPHTLVSADGLFKSRARDTDETFSYKFEKAGTYSYYCSLHPKMTGKVVVQ